jgi:hypothetical protein
MKVKRNLPALEATKCRWRKASVPQRGAAEPQPKKDSPQIAMSLRLATMDENARSALDCGREAAALVFSHNVVLQVSHCGERVKAVAAATAAKAAASRPQSKVPSAQSSS